MVNKKLKDNSDLKIVQKELFPFMIFQMLQIQTKSYVPWISNKIIGYA